jgi:hypothetical protein
MMLLTVQVLLLLLTVYAVIDMMELSSFAAHDSNNLWFMYLYRLPMATAHILPLSVTIAGLLTVSRLHRHGEWNALLASGISRVSIVGAMVVSAFFFAAVHFFLVHYWAPAAMLKFEQNMHIHSSKEACCYLADGRIIFKDDDIDKTIIVDRQNGRVSNLCIISNDKTAASLCWNNAEKWHADIPESFDINGRVDIPVTGDDGITGASKTTGELGEIYSELKSKGLDVKYIRAQLYLRRVMVLFCFTVPVFIWFLAVILGVYAPVKMVFTGVAGSTFFWGLLVTAWTGASLGILPIWSIYMTGLLSVLLLIITGIVFAIRPHPY